MERMVEFVVEGTGDFPFDMLRYDSCWPRTEVDSGNIERSFRARGMTRWEVRLKGLRMPTEARWESFGWKVTSTTKASSGKWSA